MSVVDGVWELPSVQTRTDRSSLVLAVRNDAGSPVLAVGIGTGWAGHQQQKPVGLRPLSRDRRRLQRLDPATDIAVVNVVDDYGRFGAR